KNRNKTGNILYKGSRLWSLTKMNKKNVEYSYLLLLIESTPDLVKFLFLMKVNHFDDYSAMIKDINNRYQSTYTRWDNFMIGKNENPTIPKHKVNDETIDKRFLFSVEDSDGTPIDIILYQTSVKNYVVLISNENYENVDI